MAKYNWEELKQKFLLGDYKSLREFAECEGLNYKSSYFFKRTKGWIEEKEAREKEKRIEIIERVIEKQIEQEVNWNTTHLKLWGEFLNILQEVFKNAESVKTKDGRINAYVLEKLANVMEKAQKGQRLALGLDEQQQAGYEELITKLQQIVGALNDDVQPETEGVCKEGEEQA
ncbi:hypothetical protein Calow_0826 [Caldicellulosiruptor owensensis OL]|uniref:Uncharacterized protein n=1 Tax=Caldicellulosiruptor owensensis (strain ATCC 700167 / DSM 13100 / OL) TaxID=632518 RepID=E4Q620_CALOW|nr:hypothetical protein [Caldicellulosiruptor owensensis]ADQ04394.1 hypothetical protein Calow_0826 [Caldicellulosiruptor owensensis OL]